MKTVDTPVLTTERRAGLRPARAAHRDGIALAVIDYGFDVRHPTLRNADGSSRLALLRDQNSGRTFDGEMLDRMATGEAAASTALYDPHAHYYDATDGRHGAHGTMMAALAASGPEPVDLLAIQLALAEPAWREIDALISRPSWLGWSPATDPVWRGWRDYLGSRAFVAALETAYDVALARGHAGLVVNASLGTWAGAHDGRSPVECTIADLVARGASGRGPAVAVVVPTGNAGADHGHWSGIVAPGAPAALTWQIGTRSVGPAKLEIWCDAARPLNAHVRLPGAEHEIEIGTDRTLDLRLGGHRVGVAAATASASGRLSCIRLSMSFAHVAIASPADVPVRITLSTADGPPIRVHAWIERSGDGWPRSRLDDADPLSTLGGLATAPGAIVVGAIDTTGGVQRPFAPSGRGPHPWTGARLPHLVRPGHRIPVPRSKTGGMTTTSGTSAATALASAELVTRLTAARQTALADGRPVPAALSAAIDTFRDRRAHVALATASQLDLAHPQQEHAGP